MRVERLAVSAYVVPTDEPESDGTLEWASTTLVLVETSAGGKTGLGYSYADTSTAVLIRDRLAELVIGSEAFNIEASWTRMLRTLRNLGTSGIAAMAVSAVDNALWDLKAKVLGLPLADLLGSLRSAVDIYASGGFTSYPIEKLGDRLAEWVAAGIPRVKMKVGREPAEDLERVAAAREAIGAEAELFVDANGAYHRKQALDFADRFELFGVSWFEEPVIPADLEGLRLLRDRAPPGMAIVTGEYGYEQADFRRLLQAGAIDILQADATRCAGITGFLKAAALSQAFGVPLSSHCAPALHVHTGCAAPGFSVLEYFHDHVRIEQTLFDGAPRPVAGKLCPDRSRPGLGLEFKRQDAAAYAV